MAGEALPGQLEDAQRVADEASADLMSAADAAVVPPPGDEEAEPAEDYAPGGYHPVALGDVYDERYEVQHKLGWGVYSTVWCCRDLRSRRRVALKIQKAAPECTAVHQSNARGPVRGEGTW